MRALAKKERRRVPMRQGGAHVPSRIRALGNSDAVDVAGGRGDAGGEIQLDLVRGAGGAGAVTSDRVAIDSESESR